MEDLNKKFILTADLGHLSESKFMENVNGKVQALEENSTMAPAGLTPTVAEGRAVIVQIKKDMDDCVSLEEQLKSKKEKVAAGKKKIANIIVTNWMPVIQVSLNGNVADAKLLGYGVKGMNLTPSTVSVTNSHPKLDKIELGYLVHTLYFLNSTTNKVPIPDDGQSIEVYEYFGDSEPKSIEQMSHIGKAIRGKFTNHFTEDEKGKTIWYAFIYAPKKANMIPELASKVKALVV